MVRLLWILVFALVACGSPPPRRQQREFRFEPGRLDPSFAEPQLGRDGDLILAVFRYQLRVLISQDDRDRRTPIFVSVAGSDPPDALVSTLLSAYPVVKCGAYFLPRMGILLRVDGIRRDSSTQALVYGGYYVGPLNSAGTVYVLQREGRAWRVTETKEQWVS
jgi:hypothetical protein